MLVAANSFFAIQAFTRQRAGLGSSKGKGKIPRSRGEEPLLAATTSTASTAGPLMQQSMAASGGKQPSI